MGERAPPADTAGVCGDRQPRQRCRWAGHPERQCLDGSYRDNGAARVRRVVKIGGRAQGDPSLPGLLAQAATNGDELVVVHGGGDEVTALQRRLGSEPTFIGGRRVTTDDDMEVVRMVLSGAVNKRLVRQLLDEGLPAIGISGEDGGLLPAVLLDGGALGAVGEPLTANTRPIEALLGAGFVPVVSPLGRHAETGQGLNINGDDAAAAIAASL